MIDVENIIVDYVQDAIATSYPSLIFYSEYVETPSELPCVSLYEADNTTYENSLTADGKENHVNVMYQLDVFSANGKAEAKGIFKAIDEALQGKYFTRRSALQTPNLDRSIYRITARYEAVISAYDSSASTHFIYRR